MFRWLSIICIVLGFSLQVLAAESPSLQDINYELKGNGFELELKFDQPFDPKRVGIEFINQTVQVNLPKAYYGEGKAFYRINDRKIKSLYTYQVNNNLLRSRIIYKKGHAAKDFEGKVKTTASGNSILVTIEDSSVVSVAPEKRSELPMFPPNDLNQELERALEMVSPDEGEVAQIASESKATDILREDMELPLELPAKTRLVTKSEPLFPNEKEANILPKIVDSKDNMSEENIPVLSEVKAKTEKEAGGSYYRVLMSLALVIVFAVAVGYGVKYWTKNRIGVQEQNKIRILTQHHLGPKKSLAIIQVAGESLLVGITDHSINLLKPLALLDEEVPVAPPSHFLGELEKFDAEIAMPIIKDRVQIQSKEAPKPIKGKSEDDELDLRNIQNLVASRLKEMRSL